MSDPRVRKLGERTPRWRRWLVLLAVILMTCLGWKIWRRTPALSPQEDRFVGKWALPEQDLGVRRATAAGLITNPWLIREFGGDRVYRVWIISADNPNNRLLELEGQWAIVDGKLRTTDIPAGPKRFV